ncbi:MAG: metal-dependent hydrolase [Thermoproteota archaeon]
MEPLIHVVVPLVVLTVWGVEFKKALPLSLLALLPDLDALFLVHRSFSHSLVVLAGVALPLWWWSYRFKPRFSRWVGLASLSVASHLVMDLFCGHTPLLWPIYNRAVWIQTELMITLGHSYSLDGMFQVATQPVSFQPFTSLDAPLITGQGLVLAGILLAPLAVKWLRSQWNN